MDGDWLTFLLDYLLTHSQLELHFNAFQCTVFIKQFEELTIQYQCVPVFFDMNFRGASCISVQSYTQFYVFLRSPFNFNMVIIYVPMFWNGFIGRCSFKFAFEVIMTGEPLSTMSRIGQLLY